MKQPDKEDIAEILELVYYDPSGCLRWEKNYANRKKGQVVGSKNSKGYMRTKIKGKHYFIHNLVWLLNKGEYPKATLDHINRVVDDNRIENLRVSTREGQQHNGRGWGRTSMYKGVCYHKRYKKWMAYCNRKTIGYFNSEHDAAKAYNDRAKWLWGNWAYLNEVPDE